MIDRTASTQPFALRFTSAPQAPRPQAMARWDPSVKGYRSPRTADGDPTFGEPTQFGPMSDTPPGDASTLDFFA